MEPALQTGAGSWQAGAAELTITPPLGVALTGYGNRPGPAQDLFDPLSARALVLAGGGRAAALLSLDLLGLDADLVERIRAGVASGCDIPPQNLLISCSHTHAGPATQTLRGLGKRDEPYCESMVRLAVSAVCLAEARLAPARVLFGRAECAIGRNRRARSADGRIVLGDNPAGPYDPAVSVLRVESNDGAPLALWFSHATHPVILGSENTSLSAEFPGQAARDLATLWEGAVALFAQGCCGDVNPVRRGSYREVRSVGRELAGAALIAAERARPLPPLIESRLATIALPLQLPESEAAAHAELDAARAVLSEAEARAARGDLPEYRLQVPRAMAEWAEDYRAAARSHSPAAAPFTLQAIRLGDVALLATSGETFVAIGQEIQAASPFPDTVTLGYTNGCLGYIPTASAFPEGGYEIDTAYKYYGTLMVTPACEGLIMDAATRLLEELAAANSIDRVC
jgi:hypothetical protein